MLACFKRVHHDNRCRLHGGDEVKCLNCGVDHPSTSRSCKVWKREEEVITTKNKEGLSLSEERNIVKMRQNLSF